MDYEMNKAKSLDDALLRLRYSVIRSRLDTELDSMISVNHEVLLPIVATNMSTVTEHEMAEAMDDEGGVGILHRFMSVDEQRRNVVYLTRKRVNPIVASIGVGEQEVSRAKTMVGAGADIILLDVAHADNVLVYETLKELKKEVVGTDVIVGNLATHDGAYRMLRAGADGLRVGIGGGSRCTTRSVTGHGVPNLQAIIETVHARDTWQQESGVYVPIMLDGGIKNSGDMVKAFYFGADTVSIGSLIAGTEETPGEIVEQNSGTFKKFYGMSSKDAQEEHFGKLRVGIAAEGFSELVPYKGSVKPIIRELAGGIRSGLSYSGARNIQELRELGEYSIITDASIRESKL